MPLCSPVWLRPNLRPRFWPRVCFIRRIPEVRRFQRLVEMWLDIYQHGVIQRGEAKFKYEGNKLPELPAGPIVPCRDKKIVQCPKDLFLFLWFFLINHEYASQLLNR
jgi:hypothetical protein